jgi:hypothetical protein
MDSNVVRADFGSGLIRLGVKQIQNGLCERRGTHALALKHAWTQKWFVQILAAD